MSALKKFALLALLPATALAVVEEWPTNFKCKNNKHIALVMDDGASSQTSDILKALSKAQVKATFFLIGLNTMNLPNATRAIYNDGHQIGSHSWLHPSFTSINEERTKWEIDETNSWFKKLLGSKPQYFMYPYGERSDLGDKILKDNGMQPVYWTIDTKNWDLTNPSSANYNPDAFLNNTMNDIDAVVKAGKGGPILLVQEMWPKTTELLPKVIDYAKSKGLEFVNVQDCLGVCHAYDVGPCKASAASKYEDKEEDYPAKYDNYNASDLIEPKCSSAKHAPADYAPAEIVSNPKAPEYQPQPEKCPAMDPATAATTKGYAQEALKSGASKVVLGSFVASAIAAIAGVLAL